MTRKILSIDGGGIRGVGSAHILVALEAALGRNIADSFDLFVGTSTGAILAAGFAALHAKAADLEQLYLTRGTDMFVKSTLGMVEHGLFRAKYLTEKKGDVLKEILKDATFGGLDRNLLATFYNIGENPGPVFANGGPDYRKIPDNDYAACPLWEVINASSSAPMYFDPMRMTVAPLTGFGADGGLFANNPAMCAYTEAAKLFPGEQVMVVSIGTGLSKLSYPGQEHWGMMQWASPFAHVPLMEAMFDGQAQTVTHQLDRILGDKLRRFQFSLDGYSDVTMDDASAHNQQRILQATDAYLSDPATKAKLIQVAAEIKAA